MFKKVVFENATVLCYNKPVLFDLDWTLNSGEHWLILGGNGSGKTTFAHTIRGKNRLTSGKRMYPVFSETQDPEKQPIKMVSFTDTSKLFRGPNAQHYYQQRYNAFDFDGHLTTRQYFLKSGLDLNNPDHFTLLELLKLNDLLDLERIKLSSGQTRKMLLASALMGKPEILILDNPYIGLDVEARKVLNDVLEELTSKFDLNLILSGQIEEYPKCMTHFLVLKDGRIEKQGTVDDQLLSNPTSPNTVNESILNHIQRLYHQHSEIPKYQKVIEFEDVEIKYGDSEILNRLDWKVLPGEKWVIKGNNGSGKSTLVSLVYGDHPQAYANQVRLFGHKRGQGESIWDIKARFGFTSPELHAYFDSQITAENLVLTGVFDGFIVKQKIPEHVLQLADLLFKYFELEPYKEVPFLKLSTGIQRLLFFMRAFVKVPQVFLLDEPFQGLDGANISKCKILLNHLLDKRHTLIFISHFESEIPKIVNKELDLNKS